MKYFKFSLITSSAFKILWDTAPLWRIILMAVFHNVMILLLYVAGCIMAQFKSKALIISPIPGSMVRR